MSENEMYIGRKVHYVTPHDEPQNGIVKSFNDRHAWVVYKCGGEWARYQDYTAACTDMNDLRDGWV